VLRGQITGLERQIANQSSTGYPNAVRMDSLNMEIGQTPAIFGVNGTIK
jgi:hypothetical protein